MDLMPILEMLGVEGLRDGTKEITGRCPAHVRVTGHADRHPSWSINKTTGEHICFSCGWSGGLHTLYEELGQEVPDDLDSQILRDSAKSAIRRANKEEVQAPSFPPDLGMFDPVPDQMLALKYLSRDAAATYGVCWDTGRRAWVLPIYSPYGAYLGVQFRQKGVELNQPKDMVKSSTLFGIQVPLSRPWVALVESPLDAVRFATAGVQAVASMGAYVSNEQIDLLRSRWFGVVLAMDNPSFDKAGREATIKVKEALRRHGCPTLVFDYGPLDGAKDVGEVADDSKVRDAWELTLFGHTKRTV